MKDDTISRQDAINAICEDGTELERQGRYSLTMAERKQRDADILEALPSAQQWIPVAKGLPDKYEFVLLTCERNGKLVTSFGCLSPDIDGNVAWWIAAYDLTERLRVLAWMPLPEPWKGEEK